MGNAVTTVSRAVLSRDLLILAWPTVTESLLQSLVGFADSFFISRLGLNSA